MEKYLKLVEYLTKNKIFHRAEMMAKKFSVTIHTCNFNKIPKDLLTKNKGIATSTNVTIYFRN